MTESSAINYQELTEKIKSWGQELGFAEVAITDIDLTAHEPALQQWLANNYHGDMDYMARHGLMRARPNELVAGTTRVISVRMNYLPSNAKFAKTLKRSEHAFISRYALGRDYHKLMRKRLKQLGDKITAHCSEFNFRPFVDSAPVLERPLAEKAGLGWVGKHSLLINEAAGSWFFLGELLINLPLPCDSDSVVPPLEKKADNKCGHCVACIKICPTQAIVAPYVVDARRCISYLTIEYQGSIPIEFRAAMGNRIYGCDDCQLICPWNKFAPITAEQDFQARNNFDDISLLTLFSWDEQSFLENTQGSPIRRIGYQSWQRNIAIALGNVQCTDSNQQQEIIAQLTKQLTTSDEVVSEHILWAIEQQKLRSVNLVNTDKNTGLVNIRLTARLVRSIEKGLPRDA